MRRLLGLVLLAVLGGVAATGCGGGDAIPIFFQSDRDGNWEIYSIWHDGTMETRVTTNSADDIYPAVSHDGSQVAFIRAQGDATDIILMDVGGTTETNLTNGLAGGQVESISWYPTGDRILLTMSTPTVAEGLAQVFAMPAAGVAADGTGMELLSDDDSLIYRNARVKTQGGEIAVAAGETLDSLDIHLLTIDGAFVRKIPQETFRTTGGDFQAAGSIEDYPEYDPSGRAVLFQSNVEATSNTSGETHIWRVEADGRRPVNRTGGADYNNRQPSWSGELDQFTMAFVSDRDGNNEIYIRSLSAEAATRLTNNSASDTNPSWIKDAPE